MRLEGIRSHRAVLPLHKDLYKKVYFTLGSTDSLHTHRTKALCYALTHTHSTEYVLQVEVEGPWISLFTGHL